MSSKRQQDVVFGTEAQQELLKGATILANAVKSTMGPSGHNVIIDTEMSAPLITKDGVTVARSINLREKLPSIGAELLKEVAAKTNELAGDGTTTATVLAHAMLAEGIKMIATGRSSIGIKRGMDMASANVIDWLKTNAIKVRGSEDIVNVGTISANGDRQIGELLAEAISRVGEDGIITVEPAKSFKTSLEVVEGMQFDGGYVSPYFVTNQEKLTAELKDPFILITNRKISSLQEILPVLEMVANQARPLVIIGDEIEGEALHTLIVNKMKGTLMACAVKAPSYGENRADILKDIAVVTGGHVIDASTSTALRNVELPQLGTCKKAIITRGVTTLIGDSSRLEIKEQIEERVATLRAAMSESNVLDDLHRHNYKNRLAKLAGGVALVRVGGSTEVEILEKKDRVDDALNATVAAVQEGIIPGGGTALYYAACALEKAAPLSKHADELAGVQVIINACKMPLRVIVENTGKSADVVMNELDPNKPDKGPHDIRTTDYTAEEKAAIAESVVKRKRYGYDAYNHVYGDMIDKGIIDPLKVARFALEHAASVVGLMITCNAIILNERVENVHD